MPTLNSLQSEIDRIKTRNKKVEADKAWETSWTRRFLIIILTYAVIVIFFVTMELPDPFVNAIVPAMAFVISNLSIPIFKRWWINKK